MNRGDAGGRFRCPRITSGYLTRLLQSAFAFAADWD
jgi:hypothetical protein